MKEIIRILNDHQNLGYRLDILNNYVLKISLEKETKYIIFEPEDVYTKVNTFVNFLQDINTVELSEAAEKKNVLRLPFFAGCSGFDLFNFIFNGDETLDQRLNKEINFDLVPADFNLYGVQRFCRYLDLKHADIPIYKSNNNFNDYLKYFLDLAEQNDFKINLFLPVTFSRICPESKGLNSIIKYIEEKQKGLE